MSKTTGQAQHKKRLELIHALKPALVWHTETATISCGTNWFSVSLDGKQQLRLSNTRALYGLHHLLDTTCGGVKDFLDGASIKSGVVNLATRGRGTLTGLHPDGDNYHKARLVMEGSNPITIYLLQLLELRDWLRLLFIEAPLVRDWPRFNRNRGKLELQLKKGRTPLVFNQDNAKELRETLLLAASQRIDEEGEVSLDIIQKLCVWPGDKNDIQVELSLLTGAIRSDEQTISRSQLVCLAAEIDIALSGG